MRSNFEDENLKRLFTQPGPKADPAIGVSQHKLGQRDGDDHHSGSVRLENATPRRNLRGQLVDLENVRFRHFSGLFVEFTVVLLSLCLALRLVREDRCGALIALFR